MIPLYTQEVRAEGYFIGGKFTVSYLHMFACILYYHLYVNNINTSLINKILLFCLFALTILVEFSLECSTALIGTLLLIISLYFKNIVRLISSPIFVIVYILCSSIGFLLYYQDILSWPIVEYFIVDILHEDLTLTGRVNIYIAMLDLLDFEPLWGFGNGNSTFFVNYYIDMPNTQNGLLENYINWGLIGVIPFLLLVFFSVKYSIKYQCNPFVNLILVYIIISTIEITLGANFLFMLPYCIFYCKNVQFNKKGNHKLSAL